MVSVNIVEVGKCTSPTQLQPSQTPCHTPSALADITVPSLKKNSVWWHYFLLFNLVWYLSFFTRGSVAASVSEQEEVCMQVRMAPEPTRSNVVWLRLLVPLVFRACLGAQLHCPLINYCPPLCMSQPVGCPSW